MDSEYQRLVDETKEYARLRYDLLKLELLEKTSKTISLIVTIFISLVLTLVALTYFTMALVHRLEHVLGSIELGYCIVGGTFLLLTILVLIFQKQWIINPLIRALSKTLFNENEEDNEAEQQKKQKQ